MKKFMIGTLIGGLLISSITGCQTLRSGFCSPTAEEVANATTALAQAQQMEEFLASLAPTSSTQAVIAGLNVAIGVYKQIRSGVCVLAEQESAAQNTVKSAAPVALKMGFKGFIRDKNISSATHNGFKG